MKAFFTFAALAIIFTHSVSILAMPEKFFEVSPGIYRSAQPDSLDLKELKEFGIKTILNLSNDQKDMAAEKRTALDVGIELIEHPMSSFWKPNKSQVESSLEILNDSSQYPILVHCKHGEDRTGLIIGLHRVFAQNWNPEAAYDEMLRLGFHRSLFNLDEFFKEMTGLDD
jgi:tyrosine-protein phosphatase SIW14